MQVTERLRRWSWGPGWESEVKGAGGEEVIHSVTDIECLIPTQQRAHHYWKTQLSNHCWWLPMNILIYCCLRFAGPCETSINWLMGLIGGSTTTFVLKSEPCWKMRLSEMKSRFQCFVSVSAKNPNNLKFLSQFFFSSQTATDWQTLRSDPSPTPGKRNFSLFWIKATGVLCQKLPLPKPPPSNHCAHHRLERQRRRRRRHHRRLHRH